MNPYTEPTSIENVPVKVTATTFRLPKEAAPWRRGVPKDLEIDLPTSLKGTLHEGYYVGTFVTKPGGKAGFVRGFKDLEPVTYPTYQHAVSEAMGHAKNQGWDAAPPPPGAQPQDQQPHKQLLADTTHTTTTELDTVIDEILHGPDVKQHDPNEEFEALDVPPKDKSFIVDPNLRKKMKHLVGKQLQTGLPKNLIVYGDTAGGKTESIQQVCAQENWLFLKLDMGTKYELFDLIGSVKVRVNVDGKPETLWVPSGLVKAFLDPRFKLVLLDEINRTPSQQVVNALLGWTDNLMKVYIDDAERVIERGPNTFICATQNGPLKGNEAVMYGGTVPLDEALLSRFAYRHYMPYPSETQLIKILKLKSPNIDPDQATRMAKVAESLAKNGFHKPNLRELVAAAELVEAGFSLAQALTDTVGAVYPNDGTNDCPFITFNAALVGQGIK